jgi:DNA (cytosine-5)-methyltransferase 1
LFSGAGGFDVGLERAGLHTVTALDFDEDCIATLRASQAERVPTGVGRAHLDGTVLLHAKIEDVTAADLRPHGAPRGWRPDVLVGGPPCQPFSSSGKQLSVHDPRGRLFEDFVRLATELRPRVILFENVRGLVTARGPLDEPGEAIQMVRDRFEAAGYGTRFALLNAADFGSQQARVRLFMIAVSAGAPPEFPAPTHGETPIASLFERRMAWVTLGDFLRARSAPTPDEIARPSSKLATALRDAAPGTGLKSAGAREATRPGGHWGYRQGTFVADPKRPARTVTGSVSQDWVRESDGSLRRLTWRECAALQGFPEAWVFLGGQASRFLQVGNAVPAIFGEVLGRVLLSACARRPKSAPASAPWPASFANAIEYTRREARRNGASRAKVRAMEASGAAPRAVLKGTGSDDPTGSLET